MKTILLVSDDQDVIEPLRSLIGSSYRFLDASDIEESRININGEKVDMVIIDVKREVGSEIYEEYIEALLKQNIFVYLLIEEKEIKEIANLIEISDDFSVKPLRLDELLSKIESLLHLKEVEEKVLKQYEKLHFIGERLISGRREIEYEKKMIEDLFDFVLEMFDFVLEMKEKILRKNKELLESEERYRNLFENSSDVILSLSVEGTITSLSPVFEKVTGWLCSEWLGKHFTDIVHPYNMPLALEKFQQVLQGEKLAPVELRILSKSGEYLVGEFTGIQQIKSGKVVGVLGLARNITDRKKIEEELKTASNEWRATFDSTTDIIMLLSSEMKIIKANLATTKFLNRPFNEILGKNYFQLFHGTDRPPATCPLEKMKMTKKHEEAELYLSEKDIWVHVSVDPIFDNEGNLIRSVHIMRDITEQKKAEEKLQTYQEQLRSLASQLSLVEEQERRRIAIDLHDHIGQTLAISKIKLGALREFISSSGLAEYVDEIRKLIEQIIQYTRSLTFELSPPILYELGFEAAVEWLGEKILSPHGVRFHFKNDEQPKPLNDETRILLFKTIRELMINVIKHAQARNAEVSIWRDSDNMQINMKDDGIGFDASKIEPYGGRTGGFGLFSIRERFRHIRGYLEIKSEPGHGTRVIMVVPLKRI